MDELSPIHRHPDTDSEEIFMFPFSFSDSDFDSDSEEEDFFIDPEHFGDTFFSMQTTLSVDSSMIEQI